MTDPVTVSQLRAELAEMELRMRSYLDDNIKRMLSKQGRQLEAFSKGEWTRAQVLSIEDVIDDHLGARSGASWTARERMLGILAAMIGIGSFAITIALAAHGW